MQSCLWKKPQLLISRPSSKRLSKTCIVCMHYMVLILNLQPTWDWERKGHWLKKSWIGRRCQEISLCGCRVVIVMACGWSFLFKNYSDFESWNLSCFYAVCENVMQQFKTLEPLIKKVVCLVRIKFLEFDLILYSRIKIPPPPPKKKKKSCILMHFSNIVSGSVLNKGKCFA